MDIDPAGPAPEAPQPQPQVEPEATTQQAPATTSRTGRNLPLAIGVGAGMGGLVFLTLLTVKATFLIYVGAAIAVALTELSSALAKRGINIPVIPVAAGGAAVMICTYWLGSRAALAGPEAPDLSGFTFNGDPVRWLWVVPISEADRQLAKDHGSASLVGRLAEQRRSWIVEP